VAVGVPRAPARLELLPIVYDELRRLAAHARSRRASGPYRLIRELGRGGMGTVFLAERDDNQYHARVAVKLVRPGMDTEFILARAISTTS